MEFLKELFTEPLSFEAFAKAVADKGIKLADLSSGKFVDKDKLDKALGKLKTAEDTISTMTKEVDDLKANNADVEEWKNKFEKLQNDVNEREKAEKEAKEKADKEANILQRFNSVDVDNEGKPLEWINEFTKKGYLQMFTEELEKAENESKSDADIYKSITKDATDIYKTAAPIVTLKGTNPINVGDDEISAVKAVMGLE